jgi:altronate dehydratase
MQTWMDQLRDRLQRDGYVQMSIDGQIYTVETRDGSYAYTNEFGRQERFDSEESLITALESSLEHPNIAFV